MKRDIKMLTKLVGAIALSFTVVGCSSHVPSNEVEGVDINHGVETESFVFGEELAFILEDENINLDFENSASDVVASYEVLYEALEDVDMTNVAIGTSSTVNMLAEIGFLPKAAPESSSINADILELLYVPGETEVEGGIINIGSVLDPNIEMLAANGIELFILSDAMPFTSYETTLEQLNISSLRISQSDYTDMFVLLQVFKDLNIVEVETVNDYMTDMKNDLETIVELSETIEEKSIALVSMMGSVTYIEGDQSVLGSLLAGLPVRNVFSENESSEMNVESMLIENPDYLIVYGMGLDKSQLETSFNENFKDLDSALSQLEAVQNEHYIFLSTDDYKFSGSIDFDITKVMKLMTEGLTSEQ